MAARRDYHERSSVDMASSALKDAAGGRFDLGGLEAVIAVNSSGYLSPGVAEMLGESHGVGRQNALRFNLIGHGCAGAIPGFSSRTASRPRGGFARPPWSAPSRS